MQEVIEKSITLGDTLLSFQTGKIAKQASGSVVVQAGGTLVLVTAQSAREAKTGIHFLPLTVDYQEKLSAAGFIPGSYFKREGKPRDDETLISRMIDRSIRPLFQQGWACETQVIATVFSADARHPADTLAMTGASLALLLSDIPFENPVVGIRVCRVAGQLLINPSFEDRKRSDLSLFVSCTRDAIVMVEGGAKEVPESDVVDALLFAHGQAQKVIDLQENIRTLAGKPKREIVFSKPDSALEDNVRVFLQGRFESIYQICEKQSRSQALDELKKQLLEHLIPEGPSEDLGQTPSFRADDVLTVLSDLQHRFVREKIIKTQKRIDGRGFTDIRTITSEVGILPRAHGSALFTRGETQALVSVTLGTREDEQKIDDLLGESYRSFMVHYNFPPYSVGETRYLRAPGRREIGHGALCERGLLELIKQSEAFPYVIRVVGDITESNGSSSMATLCGSSLALMDAGVPMERPCAGIAMGLIKEGDEIAILSDILGDEDHLGDMDFKVVGTEVGMTALQMDIKIAGVSRAILVQALEQARQGRLFILHKMAETISVSRPDIALHAPRITTLRVKTDRIRDVIGPGGKVIRDIIARTQCQINVEDDGLIQVSSSDSEATRRAIKMIQDLTQEAEIDKLYLGTVRKIVDFGAFVEIFSGTDGLIHITELAARRVKRVEDVLQEGDEVLVKVIGIEKGKIRLSRKEALADEEKRRQKRQDQEKQGDPDDSDTEDPSDDEVFLSKDAEGPDDRESFDTKAADKKKKNDGVRAPSC